MENDCAFANLEENAHLFFKLLRSKICVQCTQLVSDPIVHAFINIGTNKARDELTIGPREVTRN